MFNAIRKAVDRFRPAVKCVDEHLVACSACGWEKFKRKPQAIWNAAGTHCFWYSLLNVQLFLVSVEHERRHAKRIHGVFWVQCRVIHNRKSDLQQKMKAPSEARSHWKVNLFLGNAMNEAT